MARVTLEKLVKSFPDKSGQEVRAVNGIDLAIADGELMVLVGPSGCGKSTTLRMVAGLESVTSGVVRIDDTVVNNVLPKDRDIAMVFQNYALYPHMTVYQNLAFGLQQRRFPKTEIDSRVREAAALLGLETLLERRPKALSGGQRQRVALGRAIVRKPKVFLFDEPLSNLDAKMRVAMRAEIAKLHERLGATMIYVTHDQVEAMTLGRRICVMKDGSILQVDEPLKLYNEPANVFVAGFIGSPAMNFFQGTIRQSGTSVVLVASGADKSTLEMPLPVGLAHRAKAASDQLVVLGIRAEHIRETADAAPNAGFALEAVVEVAEPMGAETYLHLRSGGHPFIARVRPTATFRPNDRVNLTMDLSHAHLFEVSSGKSLR